MVLNSDQEVALSNVLRNARIHRGDNTQTMLEQSPVADSRSNGFIERAIQTVEGQIRTMKSALGRRLDVKMPNDRCIIPWLVEHAGNILTRFEVGKEGKTPIQRLKGRKLRTQLVEFGECVSFLPADYAKQGKMEPRWKEGVYLGIRLESSEMLVGNEDGVSKCRSLRRKTEDERWNAGAVECVKGIHGNPTNSLRMTSCV